MGEDCNLEDLVNNNQLYKLSEKEFRMELLRMFNKVKVTMAWTANKTLEYMEQK